MKLLFRRGLRHAGGQPDDRRNLPLLAWIERHSDPAAVVGPPAETRRHHADHGIRRVVEHERFAESIEAAVEEAMPRLIRKNDYRLGPASGADIRGQERAPENRFDAQELERV